MSVIICLFITGILALFAGVFHHSNFSRWIGIAGLAIALCLSFIPQSAFFNQFNTMLHFSPVAALFTRIALVVSLIIFFLGDFALSNHRSHQSEIYALMLFSLIGAVILFSYTNMITLFLGIEILSIPLYVLAGSRKNDLRSNEASLKYFLMGAFATGFLLMGIALIYGSSGSLDIVAIKNAYAVTGSTSMLHVGILLLICAMAFKVSLAPFHMWSPDVYQGSPSFITLFMATVVKIAGYYALYRILTVSFIDVFPSWITLIGILVIITLIIANVMGLAQSNVKRMLAYSSISHAGYLGLIFFGINALSADVLGFYLLAYSLSSILVFTVLIWVEKIKKEVSYQAFSGLGRTHPLAAVSAAVGMFSMAGIPLTAGFMAKLSLFSQALNGGAYLVLIALIASAISIAYYLRLTMIMFFTKENNFPDQVKFPIGYTGVLICTLVSVVVLGIWPGLFGELFSGIWSFR